MSLTTQLSRFRKQLIAVFIGLFVLASLTLLPKVFAGLETPPPNVPNVAAADANGPASRTVLRQPPAAAVNGELFLLEASPAGVRKVPVKTSMPVFKSFGFSLDGRTLLYTPLRRGVPSGELVLEDITSGNSRKIGTGIVISAAISPVDDNRIAYTFANGGSFGLAVADAATGEERIFVSQDVFAERIQWDESGSGIHFLDTGSEPVDLASQEFTKNAFAEYALWNNREIGTAARDLQLKLSPRFISTVPSLLKTSAGTPAGFPKLNSETPGFRRNEAGTGGKAFRTSAPDLRHEILGSDLLSSGRLTARDTATGTTTSLGDGMLLQTTEAGVVIREITPSGSTQKFVDWDGNTTVLGGTSVNFMIPVEDSTMIQGGAGYPGSGNCNLTAHSGTLAYAYDFQSQVVSAHALASADGLVVLSSNGVNCNMIDEDCTDFSPNCPVPYLGNVLVIQHADGTYTAFAHLEFNSMQAEVGTAVCQGLYVARQGHTGATAGNFNTCGDHIHFQRQVSPDYLGQSIAVDLSDAPANPLSCGTNYISGATEMAHTISPATEGFPIAGGSSNVSLTSTGCSWTAASNDSWITINSPGSGSGNAAVSFTVADNSASGPRTGTMTIGGHIFTVTQAGGGVTNLAPVVNAGGDQTIMLPAAAALTGTASDDGLPAPPAMTTTWSKVSGPGTVGFVDANALNTDATFSTAGIYVLRLTAFDGVLTSTDDIEVVVNVTAGGGTLAASHTTAPTPVDLSIEGTADWAHWGMTDYNSFTHKGGVGQQISNFTRIGSVTPLRYTDNFTAYVWNDGFPTPSATTNTGLFTYGVGNGYEITIPASTTPRQLKIYIGAWRAGGRLEVSLSDGSASPYIDLSTTAAGDVVNSVYTIDYQSASNGQTLTLRWVLDTESFPLGNITLQAASLVGPAVNQAPRTNAGSDQIVTLPALGNLTGAAPDDGLPNPVPPVTAWSKVSGPGTVTFGNANALNTTATFSTAGTYVLRLTADDSLLASTDDMTVTVNANGTTGLTSVSGTVQPPNINLTAEGAADWIHWGLDAPLTVDRKAVTPQISNFTLVGGAPEALRFTNNPSLFSWSDGTPTAAVTDTATGAYVIGDDRGFQLTVPSDTTERTLKIYLGLWSAIGRLELTSSDGTSSTFLDTSLADLGGTTNRVYTIVYKGASAGQTLTVKWTAENIYHLQGNVTLQAATLAEAPPSGSNSLSGTITYGVGNPGKPVRNVTLTAVGSPQVQTTSDATGNYLLNGLGDGNYSVSATKNDDVNGINSSDVTRLRQHLLAINPLTGNGLIAGDTNESGSVNSTDVTRLRQHLLSIPAPHNIGQWRIQPSPRNYGGLTGNLPGENYDGILLGEVTGSWTPPAGLTELNTERGNRTKERMSVEPSVIGYRSDTPSYKRFGGIDISVSLPTFGSSASTIVVPITVGPFPSDTIIGYQFDIFFDPLIIQPATPIPSAFATVAGTLSSTCTATPSVISPGRVSVLVDCGVSAILPGPGTLINLNYSVVGMVGQVTPLSFTNPTPPPAILFDFGDEGNANPVTNGQFTVQGTTAAAVSVGGRVVNANGYGIGRARITLANAAGQLRTVMTNNFGYYRFPSVDSGEIYMLSVDAKRYEFDKPSRVLVVLDDVTDADFIANN